MDIIECLLHAMQRIRLGTTMVAKTQSHRQPGVGHGPVEKIGELLSGEKGLSCNSLAGCHLQEAVFRCFKIIEGEAVLR